LQIAFEKAEYFWRFGDFSVLLQQNFDSYDKNKSVDADARMP